MMTACQPPLVTADEDDNQDRRMEPDFPFQVVSHLVPVAPYREYPRAIIDDSAGVSISVKQYIPRPDHHPPACPWGGGDPITIVAAAGLGFIKELYEPLFAELLRRASLSGVAIRSIWCADTFNLGRSAEANAANLGCDPSWFDHSRDLWGVMDRFRDQMSRPIVGLGHSYGCNQLLFLSAWHPTLFHSFIFIEPGIDREYGRGIIVPWARRILGGESSWGTREAAEAAVVRTCEGEGWDPRVRARLRKYGVYTAAQGSSPVWVSGFPKNQIAALTARYDRRVAREDTSDNDAYDSKNDDEHHDDDDMPDYGQGEYHVGGFYRPELQLSWDMLPRMRPPVLYISGGASPHFGDAATREARARLTGTGRGGNGGLARGAVKQVVLEGAAHDLVFTGHMPSVASHAADWLAAESQRWADGPKRRREEWLRRSMAERQAVGREFVTGLEEEMKRRRMRRQVRAKL